MYEKKCKDCGHSWMTEDKKGKCEKCNSQNTSILRTIDPYLQTR
ncbi:hypothetical protein ACFL2R_04025 [Patescibacteria group bacterium]